MNVACVACNCWATFEVKDQGQWVNISHYLCLPSGPSRYTVRFVLCFCCYTPLPDFSISHWSAIEPHQQPHPPHHIVSTSPLAESSPHHAASLPTANSFLVEQPSATTAEIGSQATSNGRHQRPPSASQTAHMQPSTLPLPYKYKPVTKQ